MQFAGMELARRLEAAETHNGAGCAQAQQLLDPTVGATVEHIAGASAIFVGAASPLTHVIGLGMQGPVQPEDLDRIEEFYQARGAMVSVDLCPLADASLLELLGSRGYRLTEFLNVLVRPLTPSETAGPEPSIRLAGPDEEQLWACTVGRGFLEKDELTAEEIEVGRSIFHILGSLCYLSFAGSLPVAAGAMTMHSGVATLFADSTTPGFRGIGLQSALIRERLRAASCSAERLDLATASTLPGSVSQRNYERNGFRVAYSKAILVR
jgi:hypothetical protein